MQAYQLTLNSDQVVVLEAACELYYRIGIGQIEEILIALNVPLDLDRTITIQKRTELLKILQTAIRLLPRCSIEEAHESTKIAFDVSQAIRQLKVIMDYRSVLNNEKYVVEATSQSGLPKIEAVQLN